MMCEISPPDEIQIDHFSHFALCITPCVGKLPAQTQTPTPCCSELSIGLFINNTIMLWIHSWVCPRDRLNYAETCTVCAPSHTHTQTQKASNIHATHITCIPRLAQTDCRDHFTKQTYWEPTTSHCMLSKETGNQRKH